MNTFTQNCRVRHFDPKGINVKLLLLHAWLPSNILFLHIIRFEGCYNITQN